MKKLLLIAAAIVSITACTYGEYDLTGGKCVATGEEVSLNVRVPQSMTRADVSVDNSNKVVFKWAKNDKLKVTMGLASSEFDLTRGDESNCAIFTGKMPSNGTVFNLQYPIEEPDLTKQKYAGKDTVPIGMMKFTSYRCKKGQAINLKAESALLKLNLWGEDNVEKIVVTNTSQSPYSKYVLYCGDGMAIGSDEASATQFLMVVPSGRYKFKIEVYCAGIPAQSYETPCEMVLIPGEVIAMPVQEVIMPPIVYVNEGDDIQAKLDSAEPGAILKVIGGATFTEMVSFVGNAGKSITGGWNADFTKQSMDNLTILDRSNAGFGFWVAGDDSFLPLKGAAEISYFEIKNCKGDHGSAIHACGGPVTVHHCYVHNNESVKGAIGTREEDYSTDLTVYNCIVSANRANGHGGALHFGDGANYEDQCKVTLVNNLIYGNVSYLYDGYCATFICYNNVTLIMVNNTVYGEFNYEEYGGEYPGMNMRGNVRSLYANNIIVGNRTSKNVTPPVKVPFQFFLSFDKGAGTFTHNVYEGQLKGAINANVSDNYMFDAGFDVKTVLTDPENGDFSPCGDAIDGGTLGKVTYKENRDKTPFELNITELLTRFDTDLAGNTRVSNGKVCCGCFQAK